MTDKLPYAEVIGDPIDHSKSPLIHNFWLQALDIEAEYKKTHVTPEGLSAYFLQRRADPDWLGCNVTIPHKIAVMDYTDDPGGVRDRIGAMNTIASETAGPLIGTNTDAGGFLQPLLRDKWKGRHAVLIGAGGAARAILFALTSLGVPEITIMARDPRQGTGAARPGRGEGQGDWHDRCAAGRRPAGQQHVAGHGRPAGAGSGPFAVAGERDRP